MHIHKVWTEFEQNLYASTKVFRWIGKHLIYLIELEFDECLSSINKDDQEDVQFLSSLKSLKVLKLNFYWFSVTPLMESLAANNIPIVHLVLRKGSVDIKAIKGISKLKQIKILEMTKTSNMTDDYLIELAKELPQLIELHLEITILWKFNLSTTGITKAISHANSLSFLKLKIANTIKIELDDYNDMLKSVMTRPERTKLVIDIASKAIEDNVPRSILHQNCDRLTINLYTENRWSEWC